MTSENPGHAHLDGELYLVLQLQVELPVPELRQVRAVAQHCPKVQQVFVEI